MTLPAGAIDYLRLDNPRLVELKARYRGHPATHHSLWCDGYVQHELDCLTFRSDNAYVWQTRRIRTDPQVEYLLTTYYVKDIDRLGLLNRLDEDGLFGAVTFDFNGQRLVSRDLLDSILETNFLERHLAISQMPVLTFLDIGAGYGRLAHRLVRGLPNVACVLCTDAVAESTFLCEYYLDFRGVAGPARVVPLDELDATLGAQQIDIATNIESFPECTVESIEWWLHVLQEHGVSFFMIVGDGDTLRSREVDRSRIEFQSRIEARGFQLRAKERVYEFASGVAEYGLYPDRTYYLFANVAGSSRDEPVRDATMSRAAGSHE